MRAAFCFIVSIVIFVILFIKCISFNINCGDYLKRAAKANTVELAIDNLDIALKYIEDNNLTSGNTGVIYKPPSNDIGFWYNNIKSAYNELKSINPDASILEKSNALMKLRESIMENSEHGDELICPHNISLFPYNLMWFIFIWVACILMIVGWINIINVL